MDSSPSKRRRLIQTKIQEVDSRFSQRHQGLILADRLLMAMSIDTRARCERDLKDNKDNGLHLGRRYARMFVLGHCLFLVAHSFPRASLSENCSLLGADGVRGPISGHIFEPNGAYCLYTSILKLLLLYIYYI